MMDWINGDPSGFILLQDLQDILDRCRKFPFPNGILIIRASFNRCLSQITDKTLIKSLKL